MKLFEQRPGKWALNFEAEVLARLAVVDDWCANEGLRAYGRDIPARIPGVQQASLREPIGPVAAFTPWNFPINQAVRKLAGALAAGCSIVLKGPEETPSAVVELVRCFIDAGVDPEAINLVFGNPPDVSSFLIAHPAIRKISFTGSTVVGKQLAALAGQHMKRITMELGGHAPALVFNDADLDRAVAVLGANKFRNAGQTCVSPTRFLVQEASFPAVRDGLLAIAKSHKIGPGNDPDTTLGPLANQRRVEALEAMVGDAVERGAKLTTGGRRIGNQGCYFEPTILENVPADARLMNEEPFGPVILLNAMPDEASMVAEANRLDFGLAAYAWTSDAARIGRLRRDIEVGMISVNHHGLSLPEVPFGGIKDSGYGSEGGTEVLEAYQNVKFVTIMSE